MILFERHKEGCTCSYCKGDFAMSYGLNIPAAWRKPHSWFVIKFWRRCYLRLTMSRKLFNA